MKVIATEKAPGAIGPYSQGFVTNGFVYTSGQIPVNPADGTLPAGIAAQAEQSCKNVASMTVEGDKLVFSDILGVPTAVVGKLEKIDLMENAIFVRQN